MILIVLILVILNIALTIFFHLDVTKRIAKEKRVIKREYPRCVPEQGLNEVIVLNDEYLISQEEREKKELFEAIH
jgi:hypothetical protein